MAAYLIFLNLENVAYLTSVSYFISNTAEWIVTTFNVWICAKVVMCI